MTAKNEDLYNRFKAYCTAAMTMLSRKLHECGDEDEFLVSRSGFILHRSGSVESSDIRETNWHSALRRWESAVKEMEEYQSAIDALEADPVVARHLQKRVWSSGWGTLSPRSDTWVEEFLVEVLRQGGAQFQDDVFDAVYGRMEAFFYEDQLKFLVLAPLGGLDMEGDPFELRPGLRMVKLTQQHMDELARGWRRSAHVQLYGKPWLGRRRWAFEVDVAMEKHVDVTSTTVSDEALRDNWHTIAGSRLEDACTALRVYKSGDVWHDLMLCGLTSWHPMDTPSIAGLWSLSRLGWESYTLSDEDVAGFRDFWQRWGEAEHWQDLDVALRRFSMGCDRLLAQDALLDFVIALEALLLPGAGGEYRYRLSLRGAALLGSNPLDRVVAFRNLQKAYDTRSAIVHGSEDLSNTVTWHTVDYLGNNTAKEQLKHRAFADSIADYVRTLICKLADQVEKTNLKTALEDLDHAIVEGSATQDKT